VCKKIGIYWKEGEYITVESYGRKDGHQIYWKEVCKKKKRKLLVD